MIIAKNVRNLRRSILGAMDKFAADASELYGKENAIKHKFPAKNAFGKKQTLKTNFSRSLDLLFNPGLRPLGRFWQGATQIVSLCRLLLTALPKFRKSNFILLEIVRCAKA